MQLTTEQLKTYEDKGYLFFPGCFSPEEVDKMKAEVPDIYAKNLPGQVLEEKAVFQRLAQHPKIVEPIMRLLWKTRVRSFWPVEMIERSNL